MEENKKNERTLIPVNLKNALKGLPVVCKAGLNFFELIAKKIFTINNLF